MKFIVDIFRVAIPVLFLFFLLVIISYPKIPIPESWISIILGGAVGSIYPWVKKHFKKCLTSEEFGLGDLFNLVVGLVFSGIPAFLILFHENINQVLGGEVISISNGLLFSFFFISWLVEIGIEAGDSK